MRAAKSAAQIRVIDVWDVRRTIEMHIAALAAQNASKAQARRTAELADALACGGPDDLATTVADI